jgi:hypothetical protein
MFPSPAVEMFPSIPPDLYPILNARISWQCSLNGFAFMFEWSLCSLCIGTLFRGLQLNCDLTLTKIMAVYKWETYRCNER